MTHSIAQMVDGKGLTRIKEFIASNLDTTVSQIPAQTRTQIQTWMQNKGLAIGWIKGTTTVREVLHFIVENLGFGTFKFRGVSF